MAEKISGRITTFSLSASEVKALTSWPDELVEDYTSVIRNIILTASTTDENIDQINKNSEDISDNADEIAINKIGIANNKAAIESHVNSNSEHGVTGNNVGTGDFCTNSTGGVVFLADLILELSEISTADITAAPATYNQAYTQLIADLTNENKAKINQIVLKINEIISGQQTAKQMAV